MRTISISRLLTAGALALAAPAAIGAASAAQANWNTTFATTEAGHKVGNPQAAKSLITFVSYSCPHCAAFEKQADGPLRAAYIQSGEVSLEVRHVIRNPIDLAAVLITECGDDGRFFERHRAMMMAHESWMAKAQGTNQEQQKRWMTGNLGTRMRAIASDLDFYRIMEKLGLDRAQVDRCLSDDARAQRIVETTQTNNARYDIAGTPSFAINGQLLDGVHTWAQLREALDRNS